MSRRRSCVEKKERRFKSLIKEYREKKWIRNG